MRLPLLLALLAAPATAALAQAAPPPVTREQAMTKPPEQLADIVLRQLGARVTSVTRPNFQADTGMRMASALQDLTFATAPHATPVVGLCAATRIEVEFEPPAPRRDVNTNVAEAPVRAQRVRAAEVYKVTGEIGPYVEVTEARAAEEDQRCAAAGPVIPANYNDQGRAFFFEYHGGIDRVTALLILQRAIVEARDGSYRDIGCACPNPAEMLGSLDLGQLTSLSAAPAGGDARRYRVEAGFFVSGGPHGRSSRTVEVEANLSASDATLDSIESLGRTEIRGLLVSED